MMNTQMRLKENSILRMAAAILSVISVGTVFFFCVLSILQIVSVNHPFSNKTVTFSGIATVALLCFAFLLLFISEERIKKIIIDTSENGFYEFLVAIHEEREWTNLRYYIYIECLSRNLSYRLAQKKACTQQFYDEVLSLKEFFLDQEKNSFVYNKRIGFLELCGFLSRGRNLSSDDITNKYEELKTANDNIVFHRFSKGIYTLSKRNTIKWIMIVFCIIGVLSNPSQQSIYTVLPIVLALYEVVHKI